MSKEQRKGLVLMLLGMVGRDVARLPFIKDISLFLGFVTLVIAWLLLGYGMRLLTSEQSYSSHFRPFRQWCQEQ